MLAHWFIQIFYWFWLKFNCFLFFYLRLRINLNILTRYLAFQTRNNMSVVNDICVRNCINVWLQSFKFGSRYTGYWTFRYFFWLLLYRLVYLLFVFDYDYRLISLFFLQVSFPLNSYEIVDFNTWRQLFFLIHQTPWVNFVWLGSFRYWVLFTTPNWWKSLSRSSSKRKLFFWLFTLDFLLYLSLNYGLILLYPTLTH